MPNWCDNTIYITGPSDERNRLVAEHTVVAENNEWQDGTRLDLTLSVPMPEALGEVSGITSTNSPDPHPNWANLLANGEITQEWHDQLCEDRRKEYEATQRLLAEYGYSGWWHWRLDNWGTKWAPEFFVQAHTETLTEIRGDSAWSPPDALIASVSELFPSLTFSVVYAEEGMGFAGMLRYRNGENVVEHHDGAMHDTMPEIDWDSDDAFEMFDDWKGDYMDKFHNLARLA